MKVDQGKRDSNFEKTDSKFSYVIGLRSNIVL